MKQVSKDEFTGNFDFYRELAEAEPIAVTDDGKPTGNFISAIHFQAWVDNRPASRARFVTELTQLEIDQMLASRAPAEFDYLDSLLDD